MILTYKVKHCNDFSSELKKAKKIAEFAIKHKNKLSSRDVKHLGLKSVVSNQILRKYGRNKKIKKVKNVNLTIPRTGIKVNKKERLIEIPSLKLRFNYHFPNDFIKVNQIEIDETYIYVSVTKEEEEEEEEKQDTNNWIGVDLNTTGHLAVIADVNTGKVEKLGKKAIHIRKKFKNIRENCQKKISRVIKEYKEAGLKKKEEKKRKCKSVKRKMYQKIKRINDKESRIIKDLNHKISRKIVNMAAEKNAGIKLENLTGIRETAKSSRSFKYFLHSWTFAQLDSFIEYKAKLLGVEVAYVDPAYTSQRCSKCGLIGNRKGKEFKCSHCGHVDHADVNAAFNIGRSQSIAERDVMERSTDTLQRTNAEEVKYLNSKQVQNFLGFS